MRQKYAQLIAEEQETLDALTPEVEAILNNKAAVKNDHNSMSIDQFTREREDRKRQQKLKENQERKTTERKKLRKTQTTNEHYVHGLSQNFSEAELDQQCDKLFAFPPIEFRASRSIPVERVMFEIYTQQHITIPIIHIREKLYLIGSGRMTCDYRSDTAMVKVGGGYEKFEDYVAKSERYHQRRLVTYMINNQASLEWVVNQLIEGKSIQTGVSSQTYRASGGAGM